MTLCTVQETVSSTRESTSPFKRCSETVRTTAGRPSNNWPRLVWSLEFNSWPTESVIIKRCAQSKGVPQFHLTLGQPVLVQDFCLSGMCARKNMASV